MRLLGEGRRDNSAAGRVGPAGRETDCRAVVPAFYRRDFPLSQRVWPSEVRNHSPVQRSGLGRRRSARLQTWFGQGWQTARELAIRERPASRLARFLRALWGAARGSREL